MDITVRAARESDIPSLAALERECFSLPWSEDAFFGSMQEENAIFYLCELDGDIIGYVGALSVLDECSVTNVCTSPSARRMGAGEALMRALEEECSRRAISAIFLEVRVSNSPAASLYTKLGYKKTGIRRGFYSKPKEDAYVYVKEL